MEKNNYSIFLTRWENMVKDLEKKLKMATSETFERDVLGFPEGVQCFILVVSMYELIRSYNDHGTLTNEAAIHYTNILNHLDWRVRVQVEETPTAFSLKDWCDAKARQDSQFKTKEASNGG